MSVSPFIGAGGEWRANATQGISLTVATVPIDTASSSFGGVIDADLVTNNDLTFKVPGYYDIVANYGFDQTSGAVRTTLKGYLEVDTGGGYAAMTGTDVFMYCRTAAQGEGTMSRKITRRFDVGDSIRMRAIIETTSAICATLADQCNICVTFRSAA